MDLLRADFQGFLFVDGVEAAAVDHPYRRARGIRGRSFGETVELAVEPGEVIRLADPHDRGEDMSPAHEQVEPFAD